MTAISWKNAVNGDWSNASDWSTGTVPTSGDDISIFASGAYIVTISSADHANSLTFNASQAAFLENAGSLTVAGALTVQSGFASLNEANTIGSVALSGGALAFGNAGALGAGTVSVSGGELLGTTNEALGNALTFSGTSTIAAAHGTTLTVDGLLNISGSSTLNFGAVGQDGVIALNPSQYLIASPITYNVVAGTLRLANEFASGVIEFGGQPTTVDAGATLDLGGIGLSLTNLQGAGTVTDSGAPATLSLSAADFSGVISGPLSLVIGLGVTDLSGDNTYTGNTTINSGNLLQLGIGGATGSIGGGAISDGGRLAINRNNAVTLTNEISGAGTLFQIGTGVTSINTANTYTGGTRLEAGTLAVGNAGALGAGGLSLEGGELLGTETETFAGPMNFLVSGITTTFAAAQGTTLTLTGSVNFQGSNTIVIGAPGQNGDVVWSGNPSGSMSGDTFDVLDGTLTAGNSQLDLLGAIAGTTIAAGATLDWAGNLAGINNLQGAGTVTNSGAAQTMTLTGTSDFSGTISGALSVLFEGDVSLSGLEDYAGGAILSGPITLANTGTYDIVSNNGIAGNPANFFINDGLFEKTGGGGVSDVTSDFVNNGTITVSSGSIQFSGGFTNNGVIHGNVSQSGGVTTIRAVAPDDFNADDMSDVLWRNGDGTLAEWLMNGSAIASSGSLTFHGSTISPDSSWSLAGVGDFNGDGNTDLLWRQSTTGMLVDWTMNGGGIVSSNALPSNPDSSWSVAGIGDFNGDGDADILWRQSGSDLLVDWTMNGSTIESSNVIGATPDSSWSIAGIGDFNDDGNSDILWRQSTTGSLAEWQMNGAQIASSNFVTSQGKVITPDSSWSVVGIGNFNGDGNADILWRQCTTGSLAMWLMNGSAISSSANVTFGGNAVAPDSTWNIVQVGDFNGGNQAGILWQQSTTGTLAEWLMNGSQIVSSQTVTSGGSPVAPASNWQVQARPTDFV